MVDALFSQGSYVRASFSVEVDPLSESDALREGQLLDLKVCALTASAGMLFGLRNALQFSEGNAALLVMRDVRSLDWNSNARLTPLVAFSVVSIDSTPVGDSLGLSIEFFPEAKLVAVGDSVEFYVLDVGGIGIGDVPPDYTDADLTAVQGALPSWSSQFQLLQSSWRGVGDPPCEPE